MKNILALLFSLITISGFCQPAIIHQRLNDIDDFDNILAETIIIDSISDLTRIKKLKNLDSLNLRIHYHDKILKYFENFKNTISLTLSLYKVNTTDLSFLNEFPNLKHLSIYGYEGQTLSVKDLKLDALSYLQIGSCPNLHDISAIKNLNSLEVLSIIEVANLKELPKFSKQSLIKKLQIDHMSNGRQFNDVNPVNYKTDIQNIKYLIYLEDLNLGSLTFMEDIPDFLPTSIKKLEITAWALYHWRGDTVEIKNVDNLKLYPNLKELKFHSVHLKNLSGNFENLTLDFLLFEQLSSLTDISGAFSLNGLKHLKINNCLNLKTISGKSCENPIGKIEIRRCANLENIDFLFTCQSLNSILVYAHSNTLQLSKDTNMDNIPNITVFNSAEKVILNKHQNIWQIQLNGE